MSAATEQNGTELTRTRKLGAAESVSEPGAGGGGEAAEQRAASRKLQLSSCMHRGARGSEDRSLSAPHSTHCSTSSGWMDGWSHSHRPTPRPARGAITARMFLVPPTGHAPFLLLDRVARASRRRPPFACCLVGSLVQRNPSKPRGLGAGEQPTPLAVSLRSSWPSRTPTT
jgi:hypothetical protein